MKEITTKHLYFFNPTWRSPTYGIECAKEINEAIEKNEATYLPIKEIITKYVTQNQNNKNEDLLTNLEPEEIQNKQQLKEKKVYSKKKSELLKYNFFKILNKDTKKSSEESKFSLEDDEWHKGEVALYKFKPRANLFNEDIRNNEYDSNIFLFLLSQEQHLIFAKKLMESVNKKWCGSNIDLLDGQPINKQKGNRTSLSIEEWTLAFLIHELEEEKNILKNDLSIVDSYVEFCANKIVEFRMDYKEAIKNKTYPGKESAYFEKRTKEYVSTNLKFEDELSDEEKYKKVFNAYSTQKAYADTHLNGLLATNCFKWSSHGSIKGVAINEAFKTKLDWYTTEKNKAGLLGAYKDSKFDNWFYNDKSGIKPSDIVGFYSAEIKGINQQIQINPLDLCIEIESFEKDELIWHKYEHDGCVHALQSIYKNDEENYLKAKKELAIKTDLSGNTYGGSTGGVADGYIAFDDIVISFEMSRLFNENDQVGKETWQNIGHALKLKKDLDIENAITFIVFPKPTDKIKQFAIWHNDYVQKNNESNFLIVLDSLEYTTGLKSINTLEGFKTLHNTMLSHDWGNEKDGDIFKTLVGANLNKKHEVDNFKLS